MNSTFKSENLFSGLLLLGFFYLVHTSTWFLAGTWTSFGDLNIWTHAWMDKDFSLQNFLSLWAPLQILLYAVLVRWSSRFEIRLVLFSLIFFAAATEFNRSQTHAVHFLIWAWLPFLFPLKEKEDWAQAARFAQVQVLLIYALSGFAKLKELIMGSDLHAPLNQYLPYAVAQEFVNSNKVGVLGEWIIQNPMMAMGMSLFVPLFQVGSLIAICKPRLRYLYGFLALSFHLMTGLLLQIHFSLALATVFVVFIYPSRGQIEIKGANS